MKLCLLTDMDVKGSGYRNLSVEICKNLAERGHEIKVVGLHYEGQEHFFPFSILPAMSFQEILATVENLFNLWRFDVLVVALDIIHHEKLLQVMNQKPFKYIGIMPVEADPLCDTWAMVLMQMNKVFIISEFGTKEAKKQNVPEVFHFPIGMDTEAWRVPAEEERQQFRTAYGLEEDTFTVLTVADNQERKNLARSMEIFKDFNEQVPNSRYILVTREQNPVGWKLRDYAGTLGITSSFMIFERGLSFKELWSLYAASDVFLLTSKAEGLGLPVMEAMSTNLPVVGTNCTGIKELLGDGRGYLIDIEYIHTDCFGNGNRYWASREDGLNKIMKIYKGELPDIDKARKYVEDRTWEKCVDILESELEGMELKDEEK